MKRNQEFEKETIRKINARKRKTEVEVRSHTETENKTEGHR